MRVLSLSVRPKLRSPFFHQPELNSFPSGYTGSTAVGRGSSAACSLGQRSFLGFLFVRPDPLCFLTPRRGLRSVASKGLRLHQNCAKGTVGRAVDPKGDRPYGLAKSAESHDSKGLPERSGVEERARVRRSLILTDRKNAEEFSTARVMFTPAEGKEVEFRLIEK